MIGGEASGNPGGRPAVVASTEPPIVIGGEEARAELSDDLCVASTEPPIVIGGEGLEKKP